MPIYTDDAIEDLRRIRTFIAKDSSERAMEKGAMIDATCRLLDVRPMMGRAFLGRLRLFTKRPWLRIGGSDRLNATALLIMD